MKLHSGNIEIILSRYFNPRQNLIVPNVSWGLGIHEVDLLVVSQSNYATEVEIKISVSDLKADLRKPHGHYSNKIKYLYFCVPETLKEEALSIIPERAGLIVINESKYRNGYCFAEVVKSPIVNRMARKLTTEELIKLGSLSAMRIWSLKEIIYRKQKELKK